MERIPGPNKAGMTDYPNIKSIFPDITPEQIVGNTGYLNSVERGKRTMELYKRIHAHIDHSESLEFLEFGHIVKNAKGWDKPLKKVSPFRINITETEKKFIIETFERSGKKKHNSSIDLIMRSTGRSKAAIYSIVNRGL